MAYFSYKARDSQGKVVAGLVEAPSRELASRLLRNKSLFVVHLKETQERISFTTLFSRFQRVHFGDIVNFTRQIATMVVAGLSLPDTLTILQTQTTNKAFAQVLLDIEHQIVGGGNLADSLSKYPQYFSKIYVALIRAGEASGTLDQVLTRLAETLEAQQEFRSKVKGAMIYPIIIIIGMVLVVAIMMMFVIPKLTDLYKDFSVELPLTTQFLIRVSDLMVKYWWMMLIALLAGVYLFKKWKQTDVGELIVDSAILKIPIFGELQKKIIMVEFTRTLAMLISAGIHILDGLSILKESLGNVLFRNALSDISKKIEKGFPIGATFAQYEIFPVIVSQMMKVGEETGKIDDTLTKLSTYFETESEHLVKGLTTAIEPLIMVVLGVGVGFIVFSIITPIYSLTSQIK